MAFGVFLWAIFTLIGSFMSVSPENQVSCLFISLLFPFYLFLSLFFWLAPVGQLYPDGVLNVWYSCKPNAYFFFFSVISFSLSFAFVLSLSLFISISISSILNFHFMNLIPVFRVRGGRTWTSGRSWAPGPWWALGKRATPRSRPP